MRNYRYFITDRSCIGTLVKSSKTNGNSMLLLIGYLLQTTHTISVENIVNILVKNHSFAVIAKNLDKVTLNTSDDTPYTYYDLIDECGYCEEDGYMYTDIDRIADHFSSDKSKNMLKTITAFSSKQFS